MQIEAKKHIKCSGGFTLVELILVSGTIAIVGGSLVGLISNSYEDWEIGSNRSTLLQDGQAVIDRMVRILRPAKAFNAVSQSTDQAGFLTFTNIEGITEQFKLNTLTGELEYGEPGSLNALTGSVSSLVFTCYDINGDVLTGPVFATSIQSVHIAITLSDGENNFSFSGRVLCHRDFEYIVINEFMYHPDVAGNEEQYYEWVELYNLSESAVDLAGWTIWTGSAVHDDTLIADPLFGNGSTTISVNGYAVIIVNGAKIYTELVENGGFETKLAKVGDVWNRSNWDRIRDSVNAHGGRSYLVSVASGPAWAYQDISIPADISSCIFVFWERTTALVTQTQLTVTIRDLSDQILATGYSGQMHSDWTSHTMDLTGYANQSVRIYFSSNKSTADDALLLDDVSVAFSEVDIDLNALRLSVEDANIGSGLDNNGDTVAITDGSTIVDSVTYENSWGGDGDGTTLARISPQVGSNDPGNWQSGPVNGTPGSQN
jgi:hypothetical protein